MRQMQRRHPTSAIARQIDAGHGRAGGGQVGGDARRQRATVETVQAIIHQRLQRGGQTRLHETLAGRGQGAGNGERVCETGLAAQLQPFRFGGVLLAFGDGHAIPRVADGVAQQPRHRHGAAQFFCQFVRHLPAGHRAGHRVGRQRPAHRLSPSDPVHDRNRCWRPAPPARWRRWRRARRRAAGSARNHRRRCRSCAGRPPRWWRRPAIIASMALPPSRMTASADWEARWCGATAMARVERVVLSMGGRSVVNRLQSTGLRGRYRRAFICERAAQMLCRCAAVLTGAAPPYWLDYSSHRKPS